MMHNIFRNIIKVAFGNILTLVTGIVVGFVLPKIIGITNYGYYKTFTLYITYASIFQIGFIEGIYLKYGGKQYNELNRQEFRFYSKILILSQLLLTTLFSIISFLSLKSDFKFIFIMVSLFIFFQNITTYYQYISQMTGRFTELTIRNVIRSIATILIIISMVLYFYFINGKNFLSYKLYLIAYVLVYLILTFWYIWTYRDITFGITKYHDFIFIKSIIGLGLPLMISNLCSTLIFTMDRQFVNVFFDINEYGSYSFAYNMLSLVTVATSSIATVIYPTLRTMDKQKLLYKFNEISGWFNVFVVLCLFVYFPLNIFVTKFFADQIKYVESLKIFRVILPSLVVSCSITVIIHNYFMAFDENKKYFYISLIILALSFVANIISYLTFKTTISISIASVIVTIIWYVLLNLLFQKKYKIPWLKNYIYIISMIIDFYLTTFLNVYLGMIVYLLSFIIITFAFYHKSIFKLLGRQK